MQRLTDSDLSACVRSGANRRQPTRTLPRALVRQREHLLLWGLQKKGCRPPISVLSGLGKSCASHNLFKLCETWNPRALLNNSYERQAAPNIPAVHLPPENGSRAGYAGSYSEMDLQENGWGCCLLYPRPSKCLQGTQKEQQCEPNLGSRITLKDICKPR